MAGVLDKQFKHKSPAKEEVVLDPTKPDEKVQTVLLEKNLMAMAMAILVNSFMPKGLLNKIDDANHHDLPCVLIWKVHKVLVKEYQPTDFVAMDELARKIQSSSSKTKTTHQS